MFCNKQREIQRWNSFSLSFCLALHFLTLSPFPLISSYSLHFLLISSFSLHFLILFPFSHSLSISSFSVHFLILSPFPLHFLILSPFPRSLAPRLQRVVTPWHKPKNKHMQNHMSDTSTSPELSWAVNKYTCCTGRYVAYLRALHRLNITGFWSGSNFAIKGFMLMRAQ